MGDAALDHPVGAGVDVFHHQLPPRRVGEGRCRVREGVGDDPVGVIEHVPKSQRRPERMAENEPTVDIEVAPDLLERGDVAVGVVRGGVGRRR
jgi:hypothetical protein